MTTSAAIQTETDLHAIMTGLGRRARKAARALALAPTAAKNAALAAPHNQSLQLHRRSRSFRSPPTVSHLHCPATLPP